MNKKSSKTYLDKKEKGDSKPISKFQPGAGPVIVLKPTLKQKTK